LIIGKTVVQPISTTWSHCAQGITTPPTKADGNYNSTPKPENCELLDDFAGAEQGALSRTQGSVSFVDRHQKVVVLAIKVHLAKIGDPLAIALGAFGHHGKFGGNCGQIR